MPIRRVKKYTICRQHFKKLKINYFKEVMVMKKNKFYLLLIFAFVSALGGSFYAWKVFHKTNLYYATLDNSAFILDEESFKNAELFQRASLIAAEKIYAKKSLLSSELPIE